MISKVISNFQIWWFYHPIKILTMSLYNYFPLSDCNSIEGKGGDLLGVLDGKHLSFTLSWA